MLRKRSWGAVTRPRACVQCRVWSVAALFASLSLGCVPHASAPPRPSDGHDAKPARATNREGHAPLGKPGYLPVAPGDVVASLAGLAPPAPESDAPHWEEQGRDHQALAGGDVWLVRLELPGSGAGLVFLAAEGSGYRVIDTYGVEHDGLGVEMSL